jgi:hypothetical protein
VRVRIPDFVQAGDLEVESEAGGTAVQVSAGYIELGDRNPGESIRITYPLPIVTEEISIGNPGFRQYRYRVSYKGDTVVKMEPLGNDSPTGYSEFDKREVPIFYGEEGPCRLYRRQHMLRDDDPELSPICLDEGKLDFWYFS